MGKGERILVVDDVKEQREIATSLLGRLNYAVETVESGTEAVEYIKRQPSDLVILDMIMDPGIDGLETYRRMLAIRPNQRAIIASGYSENHRVREASGSGREPMSASPICWKKSASPFAANWIAPPPDVPGF